MLILINNIDMLVYLIHLREEEFEDAAEEVHV